MFTFKKKAKSPIFLRFSEGLSEENEPFRLEKSKRALTLTNFEIAKLTADTYSKIIKEVGNRKAKKEAFTVLHEVLRIMFILEKENKQPSKEQMDVLIKALGAGLYIYEGV